MPDKFDPKHQRSDTNQKAAEIAELEESKEELQRVNNELRVKVASLEQATEVLCEREAGYRELIQNTNSAIIRWKSDGTITFFNEAADPGMSTALRSVGLLGVLSRPAALLQGRLRGPRSRALYPCPSAPPRYEIL